MGGSMGYQLYLELYLAFHTDGVLKILRSRVHICEQTLPSSYRKYVILFALIGTGNSMNISKI